MPFKRKHSPEPSQRVVDLTISPILPLPAPLTTRILQSRTSSRASSRSGSNNSRHPSVSRTITVTTLSDSDAGPSSGDGSKRRKTDRPMVKPPGKGKGKAREVEVEDEIDELASDSEAMSHGSSRAAEKGKAREVYVEDEIDELDSEIDELDGDSGDVNLYDYHSSSTIMSMMNGGNHDGPIHAALTDSQPSSASHTAHISQPSQHDEIIFPDPPSAESVARSIPTAIVIPPDEPKPSSPHRTSIQAHARPPPPPPPPQPEPLSSYTCPICFSPPTNATLTPCGHICCGQCLFTAVKTTMARGMWVGEGSAR